MSAQAQRWWEAEPDADWRSRAACQDVDPGIFFPGRAEPGEKDPGAVAKAVCRACPVTQQCLEVGMAERFGVWGGASERERRRLRRKRRSPDSGARKLRREIHRLLGSDWSEAQVASLFHTSSRSVYRHKNQPCNQAGCWCSEAAEATG